MKEFAAYAGISPPLGRWGRIFYCRPAVGLRLGAFFGQGSRFGVTHYRFVVDVFALDGPAKLDGDAVELRKNTPLLFTAPYNPGPDKTAL